MPLVYCSGMDAGVVFEKNPHRDAGVCCVQRELLRAHMDRAGLDGIPLHYAPEMDSTNDEAVRLLDAGAPAPFVVVAGRQTAGRGRLGRCWHSADAGNLYLTFAFRPGLEAGRLQALTLVAGLRLCAHLARRHGIALQVKWPNDLVCGGRKIAGILTESRMGAGVVRDLVLGLGINVNGVPERYPGELSRISGSLAHACGGVALDLNATAADVIAAVFGACVRYFDEGMGGDFGALWRAHDYLNGKMVTARFAGGTLAGTAVGLDATGALLVRELGGDVCHALHAGEVTLAR